MSESGKVTSDFEEFASWASAHEANVHIKKNYDDTRTVAAANNHLALSLYKKLVEEDGNLFFSPFSISAALAMLFYGARGHTAQEMRHALGYDAVNLADDQVHKEFDHLLSILGKHSDVYSLAVANALLTQKDFPFLIQYKQYIQKNYRALLREVDFVSEGEKVVAEINDWVKQNTKDMIPKLFESLNRDTVLVLLNAVYFKGTWEQQFNSGNTKPRKFYNNGLDSGGKDVPMMYIKKKFPFGATETFKALELPYVGDDIAMLLLLPHERGGLKSLEDSLTTELIDDLINNFQKQRWKPDVNVTLPKLHLEYTKELNGILKELGMRSAFQSSSNFKGLCDFGAVALSRVVHKAVVDVNEEGTEAAAVTGCTFEKICSYETKEEDFNADHPFLFLIIQKHNNMVLFLGRVNEL